MDLASVRWVIPSRIIEVVPIRPNRNTHLGVMIEVESTTPCVKVIQLTDPYVLSFNKSILVVTYYCDRHMFHGPKCVNRSSW